MLADVSKNRWLWGWDLTDLQRPDKLFDLETVCAVCTLVLEKLKKYILKYLAEKILNMNEICASKYGLILIFLARV